MEGESKKAARSDLDEAALYFHRYPTPGKLEIQATKPLGNQRDLALAYSPGVAAPCLAIGDDPATAADYTARANLVAVVSNGTAVLGLGNIGPLASKPVMEGKAVLFKKFAGIDVFDIEIDGDRTSTAWSRSIAALEPTFGGINLEDIKAPECFEVEEQAARAHEAFRSSTTTSTAPRSSSPPRSSTGWNSPARPSGDARSSPPARARRRLPASTCWSRSAPRRKHLGHRHRRRRLQGPRRRRWTAGRTLYAQDTDARTLADVHWRRRCLPRPFGRRRAEARNC